MISFWKREGFRGARIHKNKTVYGSTRPRAMSMPPNSRVFGGKYDFIHEIRPRSNWALCDVFWSIWPWVSRLLYTMPVFIQPPRNRYMFVIGTVGFEIDKAINIFRLISINIFFNNFKIWGPRRMFHRDLLKIDLGDKYNVLKKG